MHCLCRTIYLREVTNLLADNQNMIYTQKKGDRNINADNITEWRAKATVRVDQRENN